MENKNIDFATIPQTAYNVLTSPVSFFRDMPKTGGFLEPFVFLLAMGLVGGLLQSLFSMFSLHMAAGMAMGMASIIVMPILIGIFGFVSAGILYITWKIMGSGEEYETAYRCMAYIGALTPITTVLGIIPYVGSSLGLILFTIYLIIASVEVHSIPKQKATIVFCSITAIFVLVSVSSEIAARRMIRSFENSAESWGKAAEQAQKAAEIMQKQIQQQMPPVK